MNKTILLVLAFVFAGITSVMANTSKDEKAEVSSVDKKAATEYYLEIGSQSGSGVFSTIELINPFERKLYSAKMYIRSEGLGYVMKTLWYNIQAYVRYGFHDDAAISEYVERKRWNIK